ncbi:MAG TPA: hypothetical protein VFN19_11290 [Candidatus Nanopelagicales bacterium]|nr:hypothetical protein [Candidatus Nanopelagicales bacterium]
MSSFMLFHKITIDKVAAAGGGGLGAAVASAFGFGLPLTITNNVYSPGLILDVDATVEMAEGGGATSFTVTVIDLPAKDTALLKSSANSGDLSISISLGYFDHPTMVFGDHPVLSGRIERVRSSVGEDGHTSVVITGLESAGWALKHTRARGTVAGAGTLDDLTRRLVDSAKQRAAGRLDLDSRSTFGTSTTDFTVRDESVLAALARLAASARKAITVTDGTVRIGPAVGADTAPVVFDTDTNIVRLGEAQQSSTAAKSSAKSSAATEDPPDERTVAASKELAVLGHPGLRIGQLVTITGITDVPTRRLRIRQLKHVYDHTKGYTCEVKLTDAALGAPSSPDSGVAAVVDEWNRQVEAARVAHPAVDVGEITTYVPGRESSNAHRATLHYAQTPARGVETPSVDSPVSVEDTLSNRPIVSPFAFDRVGLMTPVYPGMRAVLVHNRSLTNDALVAGYLWPSNPAATPPPNQAGDYWLALPTELDSGGKPTGKGVHDLVDAAGYRVIHARGLHLVVGADKLGAVGQRPSPPTEDSIVIEHSSGTRIEIAADGALSITTSGKTLTLGNGSVSVKLDGSSVAVS